MPVACPIEWTTKGDLQPGPATLKTPISSWTGAYETSHSQTGSCVHWRGLADAVSVDLIHTCKSPGQGCDPWPGPAEISVMTHSCVRTGKAQDRCHANRQPICAAHYGVSGDSRVEGVKVLGRHRSCRLDTTLYGLVRGTVSSSAGREWRRHLSVASMPWRRRSSRRTGRMRVGTH